MRFASFRRAGCCFDSRTKDVRRQCCERHSRRPVVVDGFPSTSNDYCSCFNRMDVTSRPCRMSAKLEFKCWSTIVILCTCICSQKHIRTVSQSSTSLEVTCLVYGTCIRPFFSTELVVVRHSIAGFVAIFLESFSTVKERHD